MHFLSQLRDFILATAGLVMVFGIPVIIIRALNTRGKKKADRKDA